MAGPGPWSPGFSLGFGPLSVVNVSGMPTDSMQLLGYSPTQALFYDESNTQAFYLFTKPNTLYRVSPLFARNWLVTSGLASNWVYNPFGTATTVNFSNVV